MRRLATEAPDLIKFARAPPSPTRLQGRAWFETRSKRALLTMTTIYAMQNLRHPEEPLLGRLEGRRAHLATVPLREKAGARFAQTPVLLGPRHKAWDDEP